MNENSFVSKLVKMGLVLYLFGLITGALIPHFTNPRMGLSAHVVGIQNGMVILLVGLIWNRLSFSEAWQSVTYLVTVSSMYLIWISLALAAVWGTSRATPIAGEGFESTGSRELTVEVFITLGAVLAFVSTSLLLTGLLWKRS